MASEDVAVVSVVENVEQKLEVPKSSHKGKKAANTTTTLPLLEGRVTKLEEAMGDATDAIEVMDDRGQKLAKEFA